MNNLINEIKKGRTPVVFLSPHLDDAVFSAGALMSELVKLQIPIQVINFFTAPSTQPLTLSARKFLHQCLSQSTKDLCSVRQKEDHRVLSRLNILPQNLDYPDALWRVKNSFLSRVLPELGAVYPTYRWHIVRGVPAAADLPLMSQILSRIKEIIPSRAIIFCPLGIGSHVDHVIVRDIGQRLAQPIVYWTDFPYHLHHPLPENFIQKYQLSPHRYTRNLTAKLALVHGYRSQIPAIFPEGLPSLPPEIYYLSKS